MPARLDLLRSTETMNVSQNSCITLVYCKRVCSKLGMFIVDSTVLHYL